MIFKQIRFKIALKTRQPMESDILVSNYFPDWICSVKRIYRTIMKVINNNIVVTSLRH